MAKTINLKVSVSEKEALLVRGMYEKSRRVQNEMYAYCADYFWDNYRGVFFAGEQTAAEILQNAFVTFWENIENGKIYVKNGVVMGKGNMPLRGSILTYFMSIARYKFLEYGREHPVFADPETELGRLIRSEGLSPNGYEDMLYDSGENMMFEIIADVISHMPQRCNEILTKFYYEEKKLEDILKEIPSIDSYKALKTKKHKCMETLRKSAKDIHRRMLNQ